MGSLLSGLIIGYSNYYVSHMKNESFSLPISVAYVCCEHRKLTYFNGNDLIHFALSLRLPFNWRAPFGFFIATIGVHAALFTVLLSFNTTISFFLGACCLFIAFVEDITNDLIVLNIGGMSNRSRNKMRQRFLKIIKLHSSVKQLSTSCEMQNAINLSIPCLADRFVDEFNNIYETIILNLFIYTLLTIASSLLGLMLIFVEYNYLPFQLNSTLL